MFFDPSATYIQLKAGGSAEKLPGGDAFWSRPEADLDRLGQDWLITEFECAEDWPHWEMHPEADEFVYLLSGAAIMRLELPDGMREVPLDGRAALIVPRGVWHIARVSVPSRMLFVTRGRGTLHRPAA